MIIIMKRNAKKEDIENVIRIIEKNGLDAHVSNGKEVTLIGVVGDKTKLQDKNIEIASGVDKIVAVTESYKLSNKKFHPEPTIVKVGNTEIGGNELVIGGKLTFLPGAEVEGADALPAAFADEEVAQIPNQKESEATTVAALREDFNELLSKLKAAGLMAPDAAE